ncbi:MAG: LysR substrate-binding domain-containing protein [Bacteroidota bacterium]
MNFQQLEYIVAVARERHFAKAAQSCFVTQPTLSMMIKKLEEELDILIFDRGQHPIAPTQQGAKIVEQAKIILNQRDFIFEMIRSEQERLSGTLTIGIIPTLAPYLLPLFIDKLRETHPEINLRIEEVNTDTIVEKLKAGTLEVGILATPLEVENIDESPLFYEKFFIYGRAQPTKQYLMPEDIDIQKLLLLEEGHCMRSQVINLCELREKDDRQLSYQMGSLETLIKLVERNQGITVLPELAVLELDESRQHRVAAFQAPSPMREISIVTHRSFIKKSMLAAIRAIILAHLPSDVKNNPPQRLLSIK